MGQTNSPLDRLPRPREIHRHMGKLYRELALLRRLLRLSQAAQEGEDLHRLPVAEGAQDAD
jgi:hypothetical protein